MASNHAPPTILYDVCIVGAGPAGLNAALVLGRCRRQVIVFDSGQPRNAASQGLHGYLTRDGTHPKDLRAMGRQEVAKYPSVRVVDLEVTCIKPRGNHFDISTADGKAVRAKTALLATGRTDLVPDKPGFREHYGRGVYHCPYCDGWENLDKKMVAYGDPPDVVDLALALLTWSPHVTVCATRPADLTREQRLQLEANRIAVAEATVAKVTGGGNGELSAVHFANGSSIPCQTLFFTADLLQKSPFAEHLGCELDQHGSVVCTEHAATGVPGLYVAGNVRGGVHLAIMAAAEGAEAAIAINEELADRELQQSTGPRSPQAAV